MANVSKEDIRKKAAIYKEIATLEDGPAKEELYAVMEELERVEAEAPQTVVQPQVHETTKPTTTEIVPVTSTPRLSTTPTYDPWVPASSSGGSSDINWGEAAVAVGIIAGGVGLLAMGVNALFGDNDIRITDTLLDSFDGSDLNGSSFL